MQGLPRNPLTWQSVYLKFESEQQSTWCFLTFRVQNQDKTTNQITVQVEGRLEGRSLTQFEIFQSNLTQFKIIESGLK